MKSLLPEILPRGNIILMMISAVNYYKKLKQNYLNMVGFTAFVYLDFRCWKFRIIDAQRDAIFALKQYPSVRERDYKSLRSYLEVEKDILPVERTFIHKQDLISLFRNEEHHTPLERAVEFVVHRTFLRKVRWIEAL